MEVIKFCSCVLLILVPFFSASNGRIKRPVYLFNNTSCANVSCSTGRICWNDSHGTARCENACDSVYCGEDHYCVGEVGPCRNSTCRPVGRCYSRTNTSNLCDNITCPNGKKCSVIVPSPTDQQDPIPICGPHPCLGHKCCDDASENDCESNACFAYIVDYNDSLKEPARWQLEPICVHPCEDVLCKEWAGEYCYRNRGVKCFAPPCNPQTACRKPCAADSEVICGPGLKCEVYYDHGENCLEKDDPNFEISPCEPKERCVRKLPKLEKENIIA